jgi:hypothetical protein
MDKGLQNGTVSERVGESEVVGKIYIPYRLYVLSEKIWWKVY